MVDSNETKAIKDRKGTESPQQIDISPAPEIRPLPGTEVMRNLAKATKKNDEQS